MQELEEIDQTELELREFQPPRTYSRKKDTHLYCKGKQGVFHQPAIRMDERFGNYPDDYGKRCFGYPVSVQGKPETERTLWRCFHIEVCTECGKITNSHPTCPEMPEELAAKKKRRR